MFNQKRKKRSQKVLRLESLEPRMLLSVNSLAGMEDMNSSATCTTSAVSYAVPTYQVEYPSELFAANSLSATSTAVASSNYTLGSKLQKNDMIYFRYALAEGGTQNVYLRINEVYNSSATSVNISLRTNSSMGMVREISYWKDATVTYSGNIITIQYRNFDASYHVNLADQIAYLQDDDVTIKINKSTNKVTFSTTNYGSCTSSCSYGQWTGNVFHYRKSDLDADGGGTLFKSGNNLTIKNIKIRNGDNTLTTTYEYKAIFFATTSKSEKAERIVLGEETYNRSISPKKTITVNSPSLDFSRLSSGKYYIGWELQILGTSFSDKDLSNNVGFSSSTLSITSSGTSSGSTPSNPTSPSASDNYESNNTLAKAYNLGTISGTKTISANIAKTVINKDVDWFKFTLPTRGTSTSNVTLSYSHNSICDLDLELYDSNGTRLTGSARTSGTETISLAEKSAGTYYVKVYNYKNSTFNNPYTLSISHTASATSSKVSLTSVTLSTSSPKVGTSVKATVSPNGATASYQWYYGTSASKCTTKISGATSATFTPSSTYANKYIKCIAIGTGNTTGTKTSAVVKVTAATSSKVSLTSVTLSTSSPKVGTSVKATVSPNGATASYQWYYGTSASKCTTKINGATSATFTPSSTYANKYIKCIAIGTGNTTGTKTSAVVKVTAATSSNAKLARPTVTLYSGYKQMDVSFTTNSATDVYLISYRMKGSSSWSNEYVRVKSGWTGGLYRIDNLQAGKTYEVRVMACAKIGSGYSNSEFSTIKTKKILSSPTYSYRSINSTFVDANLVRNSYYIQFS